MSTTFLDIVDGVLKSEYLESHGSQAYSTLGENLKGKSYKNVLSEIQNNFYLDPITWDSVKGSVWNSEDERNENKFSFIQGDIIKTKMVQSLGQSNGSQLHDFWMALTPTCDIARGPNYIKVGKVIRIDKSDKSSTSDGHYDFQKFVLALKMKSSKYFSLPPFPSDDADTIGYYVDMETPYFLEREKIDFASVHYSLDFRSWHLLNIILMEKGTRSNVKDEPLIRCTAEKIAVPNLVRDEIRVYIDNESNYRTIASNFINDGHTDFLKCDDKFTGAWVKTSSRQVYWLFKDGINHREIEDLELINP